jgi:hypothetical protein
MWGTQQTELFIKKARKKYVVLKHIIQSYESVFHMIVIKHSGYLRRRLKQSLPKAATSLRGVGTELKKRSFF